MNIGSVIRKYRKEAGLTQEEMADRLGVTAPAVNKWENGNSNPDIGLLAPIARLLRISLDTLMSFREELTAAEIGGIIRQMDHMFETEGFERTYEWALERVREYPDCGRLIWQVALVLDARRLTGACAGPEKYDGQINAWYETALKNGDEEIKCHAADSLFGFYLRKKEYAKAEEYLQYFSDRDPVKIILKARLYEKQGKTEEAYEVLETLLFSEYQTLFSALAFMTNLALEEGDIEKVAFLAGKMGAVASVFEVGSCNGCAPVSDDIHAGKTIEAAYQAVGQLMKSVNRPCDFQKSRLFRHMKFGSPDNYAAGDGEVEAELLRRAAMVGAGSVWKGENSHE